MSELLKVEDLSINLKNKDKVLNEISFTLNENSSLAIIGESGSGKTMLAKAICGILPSSLISITGKIVYENKELSGDIESDIGLVLQNPQQCISPVIKIGKFFDDVLLSHGIKDYNNLKKIEALTSVGINNPEKRLKQYSYEMSGGMLQRIMIAIVLSIKPKLCIFDEPTTGLDVVTQKEIIDLILKIKQKENMSVIFISHDINLACKICEEIVIMKDGIILEQGKNIKDMEINTQHQYVKELIKASNI